MTITREQVLEVLDKVQETELQRSLVQLGMIKEVTETSAGRLSIAIELPAPAGPHRDVLAEQVNRALAGLGAREVDITWSSNIRGRDVEPDDPAPEVSNIVIVMSGKGGVGKSTIAVNLALALRRAGARVGLLDADIYGPSIPTMMGTAERPGSADGKSLEPVERLGVKMMSIGFLIEDPREAIVWRGPMLHSALLQFLKDVRWGKLDYLVLDLPPGTGDVPLTLSQKVKLTGAVMVTTPQEVALQDVYKAVSMCQKVQIPILGVVENESYFVCDGCQARHEIFGAGGGMRVAELAAAPLIGQIPIDKACRAAGDGGTPVVAASPDSPSGKALIALADKLAWRIARHHADRGATVISIDRSGGQQKHLPVIR